MTPVKIKSAFRSWMIFFVSSLLFQPSALLLAELPSALQQDQGASLEESQKGVGVQEEDDVAQDVSAKKADGADSQAQKSTSDFLADSLSLEKSEPVVSDPSSEEGLAATTEDVTEQPGNGPPLDAADVQPSDMNNADSADRTENGDNEDLLTSLPQNELVSTPVSMQSIRQSINDSFARIDSAWTDLWTTRSRPASQAQVNAIVARITGEITGINSLILSNRPFFGGHGEADGLVSSLNQQIDYINARIPQISDRPSVYTGKIEEIQGARNRAWGLLARYPKPNISSTTKLVAGFAASLL